MPKNYLNKGDFYGRSSCRGSKAYCNIAEPVEICWKNRISVIRPWVLPDEKEVLLGVIPLEEMDVMVDPVNNALVGIHGDDIVGRLR